MAGRRPSIDDGGEEGGNGVGRRREKTSNGLSMVSLEGSNDRGGRRIEEAATLNQGGGVVSGKRGSWCCRGGGRQPTNCCGDRPE